MCKNSRGKCSLPLDAQNCPCMFGKVIRELIRFSTFPPVSRKLLFPPYFDKFPPLFYTNSPAFYILYVYFFSPYFYHDAFMHNPMHVLDAPVLYLTLLTFPSTYLA